MTAATEARRREWAEAAEYERRMADEGGSTVCDACLYLPEVYDALLQAEAAQGVGLNVERLTMAYHQSRLNNDAPEFDMAWARQRVERMLEQLRLAHPQGADKGQ